MQQAVISLPEDFDPRTDYLFSAGSNGRTREVNYKLVGGVIIKKTKEEQIAHRRKYRRAYTKRPHVVLKSKARREDPVRKEKIREYANKPEVKKRKQELAALGRAVRRKIKEDMPDVYENIVSQVIDQKELIVTGVWCELNTRDNEPTIR